MRKLILLLTTVFFAKPAYGQNIISRNIPIKITPYTNCNIYLESYFGNTRIMADTAWLNEKSEGIFKGKRKLTSGMYFVVSPNNKLLFEFLLDSAQHFSISADTARLNDVNYTGSPDNADFKEYIRGVNTKAMQNVMLNRQLQAAKTKADTALIRDKQAALVHELDAYKNSFISKAPKSILALLLTAGKEPAIPTGTILKTRADTIKAARYVKKHYWDDVPFNDDRLLYTSFFEPKIDNYFKYYVSPRADSIIKEVQYMLLYARTGKEMYPYLLMKFTSRYLNPERIGQDKVFLYLFNNFFMKGDTVLLDAQSKKIIFNRAYTLMANQAGDPAPQLNLSTADGRSVSLYSLNAPYILVVFWDPTCPHCQKELPRIDSMYKAKWKAMGMKLYSVNINTAQMKDALVFAQNKNLSPDWIHTYQTDAEAKAVTDSGQPNYYQLYNLAETPALFLLDAEKHIIARDLNIQQFDALLAVKNSSKK